MVRPVGVFVLMFALLSLLVHQIAMFELLAALATVILSADVMIARFSSTPRVSNRFRERLL
jgi:hypothetical protein